MTVSADLLAFVQKLAPQIDRLVIAGHRSAGPTARPLSQSLNPPGLGLLPDLRRILLGLGSVTRDQVALVNRYASREGLDHALERNVQQGMLSRDGTVYHLTPAGRSMCSALSRILEAALVALWPDDPAAATAGDLVALVTDRLAREAELARHPACALVLRTPRPNGAAAYVLWEDLATLRLHRADAHALAWGEEELSAAEADIMSVLWRSDRSDLKAAGAIESLSARKWIDRRLESWQLTGAGRFARDRIERRTDMYTASAYAHLSEPQRARLIECLLHLPG